MTTDYVVYYIKNVFYYDRVFKNRRTCEVFDNVNNLV